MTRALVTFTDGAAVNFRISYTFSGSGRATGAVRSIPLLAPLRHGAMSELESGMHTKADVGRPL